MPGKHFCFSHSQQSTQMQRLFLLVVFGLVLAITLAAPPPSFDARVAYPQCLGPVVSQGECDSSFLLASLADLSASACLSTRVSGVKLSESYVAECCVNCDVGCNGADMTAIVRWLTVNGTVTQGCAGPNVSTCPLTKCVDNSPLRYYRAKFVKLSSVEEIQNAIMATGPVLAYVDATPFEVYNGGILSCSSSNKNLNDVVSLLGWGTRGGVPYWLGVNTWGPDWGENGYFQILRGQNACGIETIDYAVQYVGR